jgi:hypothetical protein
MALLTRLLLDEGVLDYDGVEEAHKAQVIYGGRIGTNLVELGLITEEQLCKVLEKSYGIPSVQLSPETIDPEAVKAIPEKFVRQYKVFPFGKRRITVSLAMADPSKRSTIADISYTTGLIIKPFVSPEHRLDKMLEQYFDMPIPWRYTDSYEEDVAPEDIQEALNRPIEPLTLDQARRALDVATHGKEIPNAVLGLSKQYFQRAVMLVAKKDELIGLDGYSPPRKAGFAQGYRLSLKEPSIFSETVRNGTPFRGPLPERDLEEDFIDFVGGDMPNTAFLAPISLRGRVVNVLYGDSGPNRSIPGDLSELALFLAQAAQAYERLIKQRVERTLKESSKDV